MATATQQGSPQFPVVANSKISNREEMDAAIQLLQANKQAWVAIPLAERVHILEVLIKDVADVAERWVAASCQAKGLDAELAGEEWSIGPLPLLKNLQQLRRSLQDILRYGQPRIPGPVTTRPDGQVAAQVFPQTTYEKLFFSGVTAEVWQEPGVTEANLAETQATIYRQKEHAGKLALVLGAGNVSSIAPTDVLYKLFTEDQVVLLKMNPVNAYLGPLLEESFQALVERGFLRVVYGGAEEGAYLCNHPAIEEIHITGSDKTFDAILFGTGPEGAQRKAANQPLLQKPITGELGNVSPVIVVPGPWSSSDLAYQAEHLATSLTINAGFNCNATRVIINSSGWQQREALLTQIRQVLAKVPTRNAYYPGARQRQQLFVSAHPEAEQIGTANAQELPWTFIAGLDSAQSDDICFTTEAFCGLFAETTLAAANTVEYIERAVEFANTQIWGTLNITLIIHPATLKEPGVAEALERALTNLRYGTIGLNYWAATSFALGATTWGAYPGHALNDIQSGTGVVHNTLMFERAQKSVLRAPFRSVPTPPWFATHAAVASKIFPKLVDLEARPSFSKIPAILWSALTGQ